MKAAGWGFSAYGIVVKNDVAISICLLIQGLCYSFMPEGSLEWEFRVLMGLSALYALTGAVVLLMSDRAKAQKSSELADEIFKGYLGDKKKLIDRTRDYIPDSGVAEQVVEEIRRAREGLYRFLHRYKKVLAAGYLLVFAACAVLFFTTDFTIMTARVITGLIVAAEGILSLISLRKAQEIIRRRDRVLMNALPLLSVCLGVLLMFLPVDASGTMMRFFGVFLIIRALGELWAYLRSRELIASGKEILSQIKDI